MKKVFGEDLVSVLLYGSCATGTNHIESDIDIALILTSRGKSSFSRDGDERSYACDRLELEMYKKLGMPVSLLVWTMERLEKEKMFGTSFARNLAEKSDIFPVCFQDVRIPTTKTERDEKKRGRVDGK